jgi:hypothetical protein
MKNTNESVIEFYVKNNLTVRYNLEKVTSLISDLLSEGDRVVCYIPGNKLTSEIFFTLENIIIAQRFDGEWGGDIILPYKEIHRLKIKRQNKILFLFKLDLMVELEGITFFVKKSEADDFRKLMWNMFEIK